MPKPVFETVTHRGKSRIKVMFEPNAKWNARMMHVPGAKWSKTLKCWHIPDTPDNRKSCGLPAWEQEFPVGPTNHRVDSRAVLTTVISQPQPVFPAHHSKRISPVNDEQRQRFMRQLQLKAYSDSTIRTYRNEFSVFLQTLGKVPAKDLTVERIKDYLVYCQQTLKLSENTIHSRMNALKFYYENVLGREKFFFDIPRPKKPLLLPKILNESELKRMFSAVKNIKHKAILFTAYGAGLRVGEVVRLRICDIDSKRMEIFVQRAKGKKDRVVNLSMLVLDILRQYIKLERPRPVYYLFNGPDGRGPYSERSAQKIFQRAKDMAGIKKEVGFHSLRHSFATHLLEKGIDVKYIKELLGHFDIRTTERYLHVSNDRLINIVSPLDSLYLDE